jgi:hypothetical protein
MKKTLAEELRSYANILNKKTLLEDDSQGEELFDGSDFKIFRGQTDEPRKSVSIIVPKTPKRKGEKYIFSVNWEGIYYVTDERDKELAFGTEDLGNRFPSLPRSVMLKLHPALKNNLELSGSIQGEVWDLIKNWTKRVQGELAEHLQGKDQAYIERTQQQFEEMVQEISDISGDIMNPEDLWSFSGGPGTVVMSGLAWDVSKWMVNYLEIYESDLGSWTENDFLLSIAQNFYLD